MTDIGVPFRSRYDADCKLCGQSYSKGALISCYRVQPGRRSSARTVGAYAHHACTEQFLRGEPARSPEAVPAPVSVPAPVPVEGSSVPVDESGNGQGKDLLGALLGLIDSRLQAQAETLEEKLRDALDGLSSGGTYKGLEITINPLGETKKIEGAVHPAFARALQLVSANKPVMLVGPSGSGKSHLCKQIADHLGLEFDFVSFTAGLSEAQLFGRFLPLGDGKYIQSDFIRLYENGGLFLLDEMDAADANTLLSLNTALANGLCSVPNRAENPIAKRHPDFRIMAAVNTFGNGADFRFSGRNQLDDASLDRFRIGIIPMDYDAGLEAALCPDEEIRESLQAIRSRCTGTIRRTVSTRFMRDAYEMKAIAGWTMAEIHEALFAGWTADEKAKVQA